MRALKIEIAYSVFSKLGNVSPWVQKWMEDDNSLRKKSGIIGYFSSNQNIGRTFVGNIL